MDLNRIGGKPTVPNAVSDQNVSVHGTMGKY